jgi:hypothetical protein
MTTPLLESILLLTLGAFAGSYFTGRSQRRNWVYQKKIEAFSRLIEIVQIQRNKAIAYAHLSKLTAEERIQRVTEDFTPIWSQFYLVSFLLSNGGESEVRQIIYGFQSRLDHTAAITFGSPESVERSGFQGDLNVLHEILQVELLSSMVRREYIFAKRKQNIQKLKQHVDAMTKRMDENLKNRRPPVA